MPETNYESQEPGVTGIYAAVLGLQLSPEDKSALEAAVAEGEPLGRTGDSSGLHSKLRTGLQGLQTAINEYYEANGKFYQKWFPKRHFALVLVDAFDLKSYGNILDVFCEEDTSESHAIGNSLSEGFVPGSVATFQITEDSFWEWLQNKTPVEYVSHTPEQLKARYLKGKFFAAFSGYQTSDEVRPILCVCSADERYPVDLLDELEAAKADPLDCISLEEITEKSYRAYLLDKNASVELVPLIVDLTAGSAI